MKQRVAAGITLPAYNEEPPYHPYEKYPEIDFNETSNSFNFPYALMRQVFQYLNYDIENFGTKEWNPLGKIINPGETVVLNPNFVISYNPSGESLWSVITHPSILRALVDYTYIALKGEGRIIIADAPQMDCSWKDLSDALRIDTIQEFYKKKFNFDIDYYDLRNFELIDNKKKAYYENRRKLPGDPEGSVVINLGKKSEFYGLDSEQYYGADLNRDETIKHHHGETHEYSVSGTILKADTVIAVPKMKVHKKVGVTLNLKGLVGINTNKNYLIHYRLGTPSKGGDQLPEGRPGYDSFLIKAQRVLYDKALAKMNKTGDAVYKTALFFYNSFMRPFRKVSPETVDLDGGNWHGNDSAWRMTADLAKVFFFADKEGNFTDEVQRKMLFLIDGIIGGEKMGPIAPSDKPAGMIIAGENPYAVDMTATRLMGFDINQIKQFSILKDSKWDFGLRSPDEIELNLNSSIIQGKQFFAQTSKNPYFKFLPHPGWKGHIEI